MPKCHKCKRKGITRHIYEWSPNIKPETGMPGTYEEVGGGPYKVRTTYQCFKCTYPKYGLWSESKEGISEVIGHFMIGVKTSQYFSLSLKNKVEMECLRILRLPILFPNNGQEPDLFPMINAFYHLMDQIDIK